VRTSKGYVRVRKPLRFGTVLGLIALGAALTAGSAAITWAAATGTDDLRGPLDVTATGARVAPALVPLAAASLAALGALLAARGVVRRAVGALTMLLGFGAGWFGVRGLLREPADVLFPATSSVQFVDITIRPLGPSVATLGGIVLVVAGFAVLTGRIRARVLGARYERSGAPAAPAAGAPISEDPSLDMWKDLDADRDPTLDTPAPTGREPSARVPDQGTPRGETAP
jgi:uncharacterized membrane protein (TIGR02234 family)